MLAHKNRRTRFRDCGEKEMKDDLPREVDDKTLYKCVGGPWAKKHIYLTSPSTFTFTCYKNKKKYTGFYKNITGYEKIFWHEA